MQLTACVPLALSTFLLAGYTCSAIWGLAHQQWQLLEQNRREPGVTIQVRAFTCFVQEAGIVDEQVPKTQDK